MFTSALDVLKAARQDYVNHGFATGTYDDGKGNRCAIGSLNYVYEQEIQGQHKNT